MDALAAAAAAVSRDEEGFARDNGGHRDELFDIAADEAQLPGSAVMDVDKENVHAHAAASCVEDAAPKVTMGPRMPHDIPRA